MLNIKKILACVLAVSLLFLCGCSQQPAPTKPTIKETTVPTTVATEPPQRTVPLHSGIREDGTFDSGTLFIGDSLTYGLVYSYLMTNDLIGDARYMATVGASVQEFFQGSSLSHERNSIYSPEFTGLTYNQAVASVGEEITAIYFMMGTNYSAGTKTDTYIEIVDFMREHCPNATIYLQMVPYSLSSNVEYDQVNWIIMAAQGNYAMNEIRNVRLLDIKQAVGMYLTDDGIHLTYEGQEAWYQELVRYAQENNIPQ